ncbi:MAG TPA: hypothetical protein VK249_13275, partial [Anaerolineales bacterium]|nr:hypothetical protein [Anaerolineales bacterium]
MIHQVPQAQAKELRLTWLYTVSGIAALVVGGLLLAAALGLILTIIRPSTTSGWLVPLQNNWLILIFKLQAGFSDVQPSLLSRLNLLDFLILALVVIMYAGLYTALRRTSNLWAIIALVQPILGIVFFMVTKT